MADSHIDGKIAVSYNVYKIAARRGRGPGQPLLPRRGNSPSRALRTRVEEGKMADYRALFRGRSKEKGLTQTQLGEMVDRTQAYIYEIESGRKTPSLDLFFQICEALDIKVFPDEQ